MLGFLCRLGLHRWRVVRDATNDAGPYGLMLTQGQTYTECCERCGECRKFVFRRPEY